MRQAFNREGLDSGFGIGSFRNRRVGQSCDRVSDGLRYPVNRFIFVSDSADNRCGEACHAGRGRRFCTFPLFGSCPRLETARAVGSSVLQAVGRVLNLGRQAPDFTCDRSAVSRLCCCHRAIGLLKNFGIRNPYLGSSSSLILPITVVGECGSRAVNWWLERVKKLA